MSTVIGFEVVSDERFGDGGFLRLRRLRLRNVRDDESRSAIYICDYVERPRGLDAVALVLWKENPAGRVDVLIREGLRPPVQFGRRDHAVPLPEPAERSLLNPEIVAGLIEPGDRGEAGIAERAAKEALEEAGLVVAIEDVVLLGAPSMPCPGLCPERHYYAAAKVRHPDQIHPFEGDGSPMEEGSRSRWVELDRAIEMCVRGEIEDSKTELGLRRFRETLDQGAYRVAAK